MDFAWDEPDQSTTTDSNGRDTAAQSRVSTLAGDFGLSSEIFNPLTDLNAPDGQKADEKKKKKPKSEAIKLDSTLLLSEKGFPKLRADVEKMRFKAKYSKDEDAIRDLSRLMNCYQIWAHGLYPKFAFTDAVDKIEKLCHERRMKVRCMFSCSHSDEGRQKKTLALSCDFIP
ncbi:Swi3-domain-containing protein [Gonapodya prolifera JEL478]|uniref:Chromosome segregation in meiosis protein n=1 Tax=Gonapodya prolifera (strain JEL478) TaxID=1344416 RepID=A0A139ALY6_GONPJ|nr:Swi3-domain-containing protein [Gonapodya prolifera JEL478]|eukprot:KXS17513.1 Swi3-domain-containing protein [Gonapodya prolifera JEL478]